MLEMLLLMVLAGPFQPVDRAHSATSSISEKAFVVLSHQFPEMEMGLSLIIYLSVIVEKYENIQFFPIDG